VNAIKARERSIMSSEVIVVLVLIALAIGFILWVRTQDRSAEERREDEKVDTGAQ
jgi:hypothetical protein